MAAEPGTLGGALAWARGRIAGLDARVLLTHVTGRSASALVAHPEVDIADDTWQRFAALVQRRQAGEPVAYLLGVREFYGREFEVTPDVLIPRSETELIIDLARDLFPAALPRALDLGTGSGALAVTLAAEWPACAVTAVDQSAATLAVAEANARRHGVTLTLHQSDWFSALPGEARFELIVANPPYVAAGDPHLTQGDVRFEPPRALASGADGLDDIRRIAAQVSGWLAPGGCVLVEHGYDQATAARELLAAGGLQRVRSWRDLAGIERVSGGWLDAPQRDA